MSESTRFVVSATGQYGVFWLGKPSEIGLRTLVPRDQADVFPTLEEAKRAIKTMPEGYQLAKISFAVELAGGLLAAQPAQVVRHINDEPKTAIRDLENLHSDESETISGAECRTVGDAPADESKSWRKWFSLAALAKLWQR
ncbi:MAG TPA: hypothetical protein VEI07_00080 [Planctomycetaceae bacterium]|nr:hypothetical protein [Planctomycetaceae bacterium]